MKIITFLDNCESENRSLIEKFGLSFCLEVSSSKILFDFGPDATALHNTKHLGIPLNRIDFAIGIHGHFDHAGGFPDFWERLSHTCFIAGKGWFNEK